MNALQAIKDGKFVEGLSVNERDLVKMVLLQLVNQENNDEEALCLMLKAVENIVRIEKADCHDNEFESLETLLAFVSSGRIKYSTAISDSV